MERETALRINTVIEAIHIAKKAQEEMFYYSNKLEQLNLLFFEIGAKCAEEKKDLSNKRKKFLSERGHFVRKAIRDIEKYKLKSYFKYGYRGNEIFFIYDEKKIRLWAGIREKTKRIGKYANIEYGDFKKIWLPLK